MNPAPSPSPTPDTGDRLFGGLRVASAIPLPDLPAWHGDGRPADLRVETGPAPALPDPAVDGPLLQVGADGVCRFVIPGVAVWRVSPDGGRITVDPVADPAGAEQRTFLYGTVFAIAALRRGLLPLHAACLHIGGGAVAFAGPSGAGKSTLAATLVRRGVPLLSDDVTLLDMRDDGPPLALPAFPRVKLWRDAMERLGFEAAGLERARPAMEKYHVPVEGNFWSDPLPLQALVLLDGAPDAPPGLRPLDPVALLERAGDLLYRQSLMLSLGLREWQMRRVMGLLPLPAFLMRRPAGPAEVEALLAGLAARA